MQMLVSYDNAGALQQAYNSFMMQMLRVALRALCCAEKCPAAALWLPLQDAVIGEGLQVSGQA